jgi:putative membrane protein
MNFKINKRFVFPVISLSIIFIMIVVSRIFTVRPDIWILEILPLIGLLIILSFTLSRFRFTDLIYGLIVFAGLIIAIGATYTYAHTPIGSWIKSILNLDRNPYDRIGHFFQGLIPALFFREILIRTTTLKKGILLFFISASIALSLSACYEIIEAGVSIVKGKSANEFLGVQGDIWDAQWDMFCALLGATIGQLLFISRHNKTVTATIHAQELIDRN